ncbi:AAA family ATPase [Candidatus Bathyarchaeota archaeon]|nr:AAA family ATPase [Candidatus Bathyarchaeota archaeon]
MATQDFNEDNFLNHLNDQQEKATTHGDGPALIIAGAGTGKTRVLTSRVAWLLKNGFEQDEIMLVTFTKKAANEMIDRICMATGFPCPTLIAGTFHHVAHLFLRKHARKVGLDPGFSIIDRADSTRIMESIVLELTQYREELPSARVLVDLYSKSMNLHAQVGTILEKYHPKHAFLEKEIEDVLAKYFNRKQRSNVLDFDDLLVYFLRLLRTGRHGQETCAGIKHLLVDEYQDVNQLQADIVFEIGKHVESLVVVGDDAQSIYSFRGSDVRHVQEFKNLFDEDVTTYFLTRNYRSTPQILKLANAILERNTFGFKKELVTTKPDGPVPELIRCIDQDEEAHTICQHVLAARNEGIGYGKQAILFRAAHHALPLQKTLVTYKIPYIIRAGIRFFETAHVKDLLSFAMILQNPLNEIPWSRAFTLLPGVGERTAAKLVSYLQASKDPLGTFIHENIAILIRGKRVMQKSVRWIEEMRQMLEPFSPRNEKLEASGKPMPSPFDILKSVHEFYQPLMSMKYNDAGEREKELEAFMNLAKEHASLDGFLAEIMVTSTFAGDAVGNTGDEKQEPLVLTTVHQAKGLEWSIVHVMGLCEGMFPHSKSIDDPDELEEERRLFYVAVTRAKDKLVLTYPQSMSTFNDSSITSISRFLHEIENDGVYKTADVYFGVTNFDDLI